MKKFSPLFFCIAFSVNALAIDSFPSNSTSHPPSQYSLPSVNNEYIDINDPTTGNFQIEKNPVTVQQYTDFLNAVAVIKDLHHLYIDEMKGLITYHPPGWIEGAYYSVVKNQGDLPMIFITTNTAMHYCNWKEWGAPPADETEKLFTYSGNDVTESGAYDFSNRDGQETITPHPGATYQLPTPDQLITALPKIVVPLNSFYEWTLSKDSEVLPTNSLTDGQLEDSTPVEQLTPFLIDDHHQSEATNISTILGLTGFRIVEKKNSTLLESALSSNTSSTLDQSENLQTTAPSSLSWFYQSYSWVDHLTPLEKVTTIVESVIAITIICFLGYYSIGFIRTVIHALQSPTLLDSLAEEDSFFRWLRNLNGRLAQEEVTSPSSQTYNQYTER